MDLSYSNIIDEMDASELREFAHKVLNLSTGEITVVKNDEAFAFQVEPFIKSRKSMFQTALSFSGDKEQIVFAFLCKNMDSENMYYGSYDDISKKSGVPRATVARALKDMRKVDLIRPSMKACWMVNPSACMKGKEFRFLILKKNFLNLEGGN